MPARREVRSGDREASPAWPTAHRLGFKPLQINSVTFADGSTANKRAVVSDFGGTAEVNQYCPSDGGPFGPDSTHCDTVIRPALSK